jgi:signal transduction histidine kinase
MNLTDSRPVGVRGVLARSAHFKVWVNVAFVLATVASAARYVGGHGFGDRAPLVLGGAAVLIVSYGADPLRRTPMKAQLHTAWCLALVVIWIGLVALAPSFAWVAVPLSFVAMRVLAFPLATGVIGVMTAVVIVAWTAMQDRFDPTVVVGPLSIAALTVIAYRALERESAERRRLHDELRDAQGDLSEAQHTAGVLAERSRLSREIHDSVAQGLSSINLLLQAAEQDWESRPEAARENVGQAALTARDGLDEVRRIVRDLAPTGLGDSTDDAALPAALRRACERAVAASQLQVDIHVHGEPTAVPTPVATAVLRTARGALANVIEHAAASRAAVSLTFQPDAVILDVRDDGRGFDPTRVRANGDRGRGLAGLADRARAHGGTLAVESAPGAGTAVAVLLPLANGRAQ